MFDSHEEWELNDLKQVQINYANWLKDVDRVVQSV
jgi:hypothetical protein